MNKNSLKIFTSKEDKNLAFHVNDDELEVKKNRHNLSLKYEYNNDTLKYMNQTHSNKVLIVNNEQNIYDCDGLVSSLKDTTLMVMVADCIPILFYDEINEVIAVAHAGRNGTYLNISKNVIDIMKDNFNCQVENIKVILGPSIQMCCYEVSPELALIASNSFGESIEKDRYINLQKINENQLLEQKIPKENIEISPTCTKCGDGNYFSYRQNKNCGRFAGIISL
jgi:YfiH family protein